MRIPIAKEGLPFALIPLLLSPLPILYGRWEIVGFLLGLALFILFFFRDPERILPDDPSILVSPADGRVVRIEKMDDPNWGPQRRISIFLSIFNVHINRSPLAASLQEVHYVRGKFLAAFNHEASSKNERNTLELIQGKWRIWVTQITGLIARRIVCWKKKGDLLERGERFGLIRFGSRVDIVLPLEIEILVKVGDKVRGGSSPLARFPVS